MERAAAGSYGEDSEIIGKLFGILAFAKFDRGSGPFICGYMGEAGPDGLHEGYMICPMYGADANCTVIYSRAVPPSANDRPGESRNGGSTPSGGASTVAQASTDTAALADALEKADWSGVSIGNKVMLKGAIEILRSVAPAQAAPDPERVTTAIYTAQGLYLSPADAKKAAYAAIAAMSGGLPKHQG
jgi:hypothetical protein